jgi:hypothetical protein
MPIGGESVRASPASLSATPAFRFADRKWGDRLVPIRWVPDEARAGDQPDWEKGLVAGRQSEREIVLSL